MRLIVGNHVYRKVAYKPDDYWYHVTVSQHLPDIAQGGLRPTEAPGVHFSERTAVPRWYQWVSAEIPHKGFDPDAVPVVLRVPKGFPTELDEMGTRDTERWMSTWMHHYYPELFEGEDVPENENASEYWQRVKRDEQRIEELEKSFIPYAKAVYTTEGVDPELLDVYSGYEWIPVANWDEVPLQKARGPQGNLYEPHKNPLVPTL